ncbi:beta-lactamase family protein [Kordiimonas sp. SCSIO 12603]|uniref:serine hydrolase domain-containing protein n=1 Tax=Kordiimonas sp. SCSIO 12603 TaxID=2829596 RepID=UPI0021023409|nr:serine hydrolase domain-containing protein [Kordiimonas sp. SCSIO 12603]UTW59882.1 beta-lactamase family protein [Kordiimonas sp. SCSIO 12603]
MKKTNVKQPILRALTGVAVSALMTVASVADDVNFDIRLEKLAEALEEKRQELHIPGMAVAIIKDDKIIMARGFGKSDLEAGTAVTPETVFGIGSTSKAFTSTLVGMLADEGKLAWDDAATKYIPWFTPQLKGAEDDLTIRDMLSHRSGISRNDILWASGKVGREAMMRESLDAEPLTPFRKQFNYNNVMYVATGMASAKAVGAHDWDTLLETRILEPLDMDSTTSRDARVDEVGTHAKGYRWNEDTGSYTLLERKNTDNIGAAGGIHSNVLDMANWVRFHLNKGSFKGEKLLSDAQYGEMWNTQIQVGGGATYGLGWFLREWEGKKIVEHGGNILGYAAQVALMPEENLGFVLLANVTASPLQQGSMPLVWDMLLGEEAEGGASESFDTFIGEYTANFGPFNNATFTVKEQNGRLAVDVPGQQVFELKAPDEEGKRYFVITNQVAVSFDGAENGKANQLKMYQNGMTFELPRKGVTVKAEVDIETLQPFVGDYEAGRLPAPIKAQIVNNRLAIDVPGEMVYELHLPDEKGHRQFRVNPQLSAKFTVGDSGAVEKLAIYRGERKALEATRANKADAGPQLPTADDIAKLRKVKEQVAAFQKAGGFRFKGTLTMKQAGVSGTLENIVPNEDSFEQHVDFGDYGQIRTVVNPEKAFMDNLGDKQNLTGIYETQVRRDHPLAGLDWATYYDQVLVVGQREHKGRKVLALRLKKEGLPDVRIMLDAETGDVLRARGRVLNQVTGPIPFETTFSDYRDVNGLRIPFKVNQFTPMAGNILIEYESVEPIAD